MKLFSKIKAAAGVIFKSGAPFPFNKIMPYDAMGGEKMYRAFEQSTWVMRAIKKIAGPISAVDLNFTRGGQRFHQADLEAFWESPATGMTRSDLIEATVGWLKLEGEAFWIMDDSWLMPFAGNGGALGGGQIGGAHRAPLQVARPDRMRHVVRNGALEGWEHTDAAGNHALLLPEQVVQLKMWNPYNDWRGMAELKPCRDAAEADFLAGKFNLNLMRNNGDQGVYVIAKQGLPQDGQRQAIVDQIREKRELAQRGVFKPVFLDGDISIEDPKIRVPDADFMAARLQNRHEVFIAMGVPASMADVKASYSIGSASDWFMLIAETCIPLGEKICEGINQVLRRQGASEVRAGLNWDEHPVIQAVRRERADTAAKYFAMGVPLKALNDYLDLELPACPAWEKGYVPAKLTEIGEAEPAGGEPMEDAVALMRRALGGNCGLRIADCGLDGVDTVTESGGGGARSKAAGVPQDGGARQSAATPAHWVAGMGKAFVSRFNRELMKARTETLRRAEGGDCTGCVFDTKGFTKGLAAGLRPVLAAALENAGSGASAERVREFLDGREVKWREAAEGIGREIEAAALEAADGKWDAVRARFNEAGKRRGRELAAEEARAVEEWRNCGLRIADCGLDGVAAHSKAAGFRQDGGARQSAATPGAATGTGLPLRRLIHPEVRVVDARNGIVDYVASDETIDSYKEIIRAGGWRFTHFAKNAPFVDSHDYSSIEKCLGRVIDFRVEGARLIERVQWAIDVPENKLAQIGWKMTQAGYLKAVSVGFFPVKYLTPGSGEDWGRQLKELGLPGDAAVRTIYTEQEQVELSCCVVGSNPNALAKARQAGAIDDADMEVIAAALGRFLAGGEEGSLRRVAGDDRRAACATRGKEEIFQENSQRENGRAADCPAPAAPPREQARTGFLEELQKAMSQNKGTA